MTLTAQQAWPLFLDTASGGGAAFVAELSDPFYFAFSYYLSLTGKPIPKLDTVRENIVYRHLLSNSYKPNSFIVSLGIYPLPIAGAAIKAWSPQLYRRSKTLGTNLVRAITESVDYRSPWSISLFFGNLFLFKQIGEITGLGSIGLLSSYGYYFIFANTFLPDHWGEFEAKMKIDKAGPGPLRRYTISYRIGGMIHSNHEIKDIVYLSLKRDRTDWEEKGFSFIKNTILEARTDIAVNPVDILLVSADVGKKWPLRLFGRRAALGVALGVTWYIHSPFKGRLDRRFGKDYTMNAVPIISPRLAF